MSEMDQTPEIEGEHFMKVSMAHYNALKEAADIGYETLVARRNSLKVVARNIPQYPERDNAKMEPPTHGLLDGIPLDDRDVNDLVRRYDQRIQQIADALNQGMHRPRYG